MKTEKKTEKYHITSKGTVELCNAYKKPCPLGIRRSGNSWNNNEEQSVLHFTSKEQGQIHADELNRFISFLKDFDYDNDVDYHGFYMDDHFQFSEQVKENKDEIIDRAYSELGFKNIPKAYETKDDSIYIYHGDSSKDKEAISWWSELIFKSYGLKDDYLETYRPNLCQQILEEYDERYDDYFDTTLTDDEVIMEVGGFEHEYDGDSTKEEDFNYYLKNGKIPMTTLTRKDVTEVKLILLRHEV